MIDSKKTIDNNDYLAKLPTKVFDLIPSQSWEGVNNLVDKITKLLDQFKKNTGISWIITITANIKNQKSQIHVFIKTPQPLKELLDEESGFYDYYKESVIKKTRD